MASMDSPRLTLFSFSTFGTLYVAMLAMVEGLKPFEAQAKGATGL